jgi:hypothetical protein
MRVSAGNTGDVRIAFKINYMKFQTFGGGALPDFATELAVVRQPN